MRPEVGLAPGSVARGTDAGRHAPLEKLCDRGNARESDGKEAGMSNMARGMGWRMALGALLAGSLGLVACGGAPGSQTDDGGSATDATQVSFQSDDGQEVRTSSDLGADGGDGTSDGTTEGDGDAKPDGDDAGGQDVSPDAEPTQEEPPAPDPEPEPAPVDASTRTISGEQSDPGPVDGTVIGSWSVRGASVSGVTEACIYKDGKALVVMGRRRVTGTWESPATESTATVRDEAGTPILSVKRNEDDTLSWHRVDADGNTRVGDDDVAARRR